jgi:hypothetical protein
MKNGNYPGDGSSELIIRESIHTNYRPLLFCLWFDLILLAVLLGVPRLAGKPSWASWTEIVLFLLTVLCLCIYVHTLVNHGVVNRHLWRTACLALPISLSLSLYYWYTRIDIWKGAGIGPEHTYILVVLTSPLIWVPLVACGRAECSESNITSSEEEQRS